MTFTEIVTEIEDRLDLTSTDATTRIGRRVNSHYKRLTAELSLAAPLRRVAITANSTIGSANITFTSCEKIERLFDRAQSDEPLTEVSFDELQQNVAVESDTPTKYAIERMGATTVLVRFDVEFESVKAITGDGYTSQATLSGSDVPAFPVTYHDILVHRVLEEELLKLEKPGLARVERDAAKDLMSKLRLWVATSAYLRVRQGDVPRSNSVLTNE